MFQKTRDYFAAFFQGDRIFTETIINEFKKDYIDCTDIYERISPDMKGSFAWIIERYYERAIDALSNGDNPKAKKAIFNGIRELYFSLWLEDTGYGKKLALKRSQLTYVDEYGDERSEKWDKEIKRFVHDRVYKITSYMSQAIPQKYQSYCKQSDKESSILDFNISFDDWDIDSYLVSEIELSLSIYETRLELDDPFFGIDEITSNYEYELKIAQIFESLGWSSEQISLSGGGSNVVAEKYGLKLVIKCKVDSKSIRHKIIQQAAQAKEYYNTDLCAVVSNSHFTEAANEFANSIGVVLVHHSQIAAFDELVFKEN